MTNKHHSTGLSFALLLTGILILLRITQAIDWDWIWLFTPIYILIVLWMGVVGLVAWVSDSEIDESDQEDQNNSI